MFEILVFPLSFVTFCLYIFQIVSGSHSRAGVGGCLFLSIALSAYFIWKKLRGKGYLRGILKKIKAHILAIAIIFSFCTVVNVIISPLIISQKVDGHTFLRFPGVLDYYKHAYTITALNQSGITPQHPYFPPTKFSYYYGYYIIPAAVSNAFNIDQNVVLFFYVFFTNVISLSLLYWLVTKLIKSPTYRIIGLLTLMFGTAYDVFFALGLTGRLIHIENWFGTNETGLIAYNNYTALLWQPQHMLAAAIAICLIYKLAKEKMSIVMLSLAAFFTVISSVFVGLTMTLWLGIIFFIKKESRLILIFSGLVAGAALLPFFLSIGGRSGIVFPYVFKAYPFSVNTALNTFLTLTVEYGFSLLGLLYLIVFTKTWGVKQRLMLAAGILLPIVFTWFYRSSGPNDFAMKVIMPVGIAYNLLFVVYLSGVKNGFLKTSLTILVCASILSGIGGATFEYYHRWKSRFVLSLQDSDLELAVRKLDKNIRLATIGKEEWMFYIPVLGYHSILSPSLYDAGMYANKFADIDKDFTFAGKGGEIFSSATEGKTISDVIIKRNMLFDQVNRYFSMYDFDYLILPKKQWVKQGQNFWFGYMNKLGVTNKPLTDQISMFDRGSILQKTGVSNIEVNQTSPEIFMKRDKTFTLKGGFWFVTACSDPDKDRATVEFDEYYSLFDIEKTTGSSCGGQVFFIDNTNKITISSRTNVEKIVFYPIEFINN